MAILTVIFVPPHALGDILELRSCLGYRHAAAYSLATASPRRCADCGPIHERT